MSSNSNGDVASSTSSEALALPHQPKTKKPKKLLKRDDPELKAAKEKQDLTAQPVGALLLDVHNHIHSVYFEELGHDG